MDWEGMNLRGDEIFTRWRRGQVEGVSSKAA